MTREELQRIFTDPPEIETERLLLRRISVGDADDMYEYSRREDVTRFLLWEAHPDPLYTEKYVRYLQERYAVGDFYDFALELRETGKMIGTAGFTTFDLPNRSAEIGYVVSPDYRGQGYAPEAVEALLSLGFEHFSLARISAVCMKDNAASLRVMEKCGLKREGLLRSAVYAKGEMQDVHLAAITSEDYFSRACI